MNAFRVRNIVVVAWLLFWALMVTVSTQEYLRNSSTDLWQPALWETSSSVICALLVSVQRVLTRRYDFQLATPLRWFARQLAWLPFNCIVFVPLTFGLRHVVYALIGREYTHQAWPQLLLYESLKVSLFFGIFTVILFGFLSYQALLAERERAERANHLLRQTQLQGLTQQMQPHFLFNALNTVSSLMHSDVDKADATLIQLADVLRATLDLGEQHETTLATELRLARGYANLMAERFSDRVVIDWRIDAATLACKLPVMCLQPLIENVFKHTVEQRLRMTRIVVGAQREGDTLVLRVDDDAGTLAPSAAPASSAIDANAPTPAVTESSPPASGIGLSNLRARLATLYGDGAGLTLSALSPAGVRAELRLPCAS